MTKKKFDISLGNPPYEGSGNPLYLQILDKVINVADETVWLCPSQWVKTFKPNKFYDAFKEKHKLSNHKFVGNPFDDASVANDIAVFVFDNQKEKEDYSKIKYERFKNKTLAESIWNKIEKYKDNINAHRNIELDKKFYVKAAQIRGHINNGKPCWDWTTLFGPKQREDFSKDLKEGQMFWNFDTEKECRNFIASTETDICMFALYCSKMNTNNHVGECKYIPWFGDYTCEWTEKDIQKELGITDEELDYIHEEMKDFGWKTRNK